FDRCDQTLSKYLLPDTIDHRSCGQRILFIHDPLRQSESVSWGTFREWIEDFGHIGFDRGSFDHPVAFFKYLGSPVHGRWIFDQDGYAFGVRSQDLVIGAFDFLKAGEIFTREGRPKG